jgi:hypothetical protein
MVCTGIACVAAAAGAAGFWWQPVAANPNKTKLPIPIKRFNALFLT